MTRILVILLIVFISITNVLGQKQDKGIPKIVNYPPKVYGYEGQNFSVITDDKGVVYSGNLNGILIYDGKSWKFIYMPGGPNLSKTKKGDIYAGGYNNFGVFKKHNNGALYFYSLIDKFPEKYQEIGQINSVQAVENDVIFTNNNSLFFWNNNTVYLIDTNNAGYKTYKINDDIFVDKKGKGIYKYVNNGLDEYCNETILIDNNIEIILPYKNKLLVKLKHKGFFIVDKNCIEEFETSADYFFENTELTAGARLDDEKYVLGSSKCGIIVITEAGQMLCNINTDGGLYDDKVNAINVDYNDKSVWVALNNGLSRIDMPSAFTFFDKSSGLRNGTYDITRFDNTIFVATGHGVFYQYGSCVYSYNRGCYLNKRFLPIDGVNSRCNKFIRIDTNLYVTSEDGLYKIKNKKAELIFEGDFKRIKQSNRDSSIYFISSTNGLYIAEFIDGKFELKGKIKDLNESVRTIAEAKNGFVWLGSDYQGVIMLNFSERISLDCRSVSINTGFGLPKDYQWIDVYETSNGVLFSTSKGIYRYDSKMSRFFVDTLLNLDFKQNKRWVYPISEDKYKNLWFSSGVNNKFNKTTGVCLYSGEDKKYKVLTKPFNILNDLTIEVIFCDKDSIIYMGSYDKIVRIDVNSLVKHEEKPNIYFNKITLNEDSVIFNMLNINNSIEYSDSLKIKYSYNNIDLSFYSTSFVSGSDLYYSYMLENYDDDWSDWGKTTEKEYTNLPEGKYAFKIKSKDIFGNISEVKSYVFKVKPPKYRTWYAYMLYLIFLVSLIVMIVRYRAYLYAKEKYLLEKEIADKTEEVVRQKEKAEMLIRNMLPEDTAKELQAEGHAKRRKYENATVLFSDIQGFTSIAEHMQPDALIDELDRLFFKFDSIVGKFNIEKIKTIGDAYMCAGGIPKQNITHAIDVTLAAIEIIDYMKELREDAQNKWRLRIGIHTGPIIAGVVGSRKLSYDIWGDTVNIASRMESSGVPGQINISTSTYEKINNLFECDHRGKLPIKYKGELDMYFVLGIKPEYSVNGEGRIPNEKFRYQYQKINYFDLEDLVFYKLEKGLNPDIKYHNVKHTIDVVNEAEKIARSEGVSNEDLLLIKTAALLHDIGFIIGYSDHEESSVKLAKEILPKFWYTQEQIQTISELIHATKSPPNPRNELEKIMCDADLDYLGRPDFIPVSKLLFEELFKFNMIKSEKEWNKIQIKFLESHQYFTETARRNREVNKNIQLEKLKKLMSENQENKDKK